MGSVSGWIEGILLSLTFLGIFTLIITSMNIGFTKNYNIGLVDNGTQQQLTDYMTTSEKQISGGDVDLDAQSGITLKSAYGLVRGSLNIIWSFITGGFIENAINYLNLGAGGVILAKSLRILFFLSLVFALLYAIFKISI